MSERAARGVLLVLCLLAPAVYLPRVWLGRGTPLPAAVPPAWMHLVVITVGDADALAARPGADDALAAFDRRASRVEALWAAAPSGAAAAASFWTGRYPSSHGVTGRGRALGPGVWTLARAARGAGTRTAAFLQERFVEENAIQGFDEVDEGEPDARALVERAAGFLERTAGERALVWLHLEAPDRALVSEALERIDAALAASDRRPESAVALFALTTGPPRPPLAGAADGLPALRVVLPGALSTGRRSAAHLSQVDLAGLLARLAGLRAPADAPLAARAELCWSALNGASPRPGVLFEDEQVVWQRGELRAVLDPRTGSARAERLSASGADALGGAEAAAFLDEARAGLDALARPRTPSREVER